MKQKWLKKILWGVGGLIIFILISVAVILLWLRTSYGSAFVYKQLVEVLAAKHLYLEAENVHGPLPQKLVVEKIVLKDDEGSFLLLNSLEMKLKLWPLLKASVEIESLELKEPELLRLPKLPPAPVEKNEAPINLPVDILLEKLSIHNGSLGAEVLTPQGKQPPLNFNLQGQSLAWAGTTVKADFSLAAEELTLDCHGQFDLAAKMGAGHLKLQGPSGAPWQDYVKLISPDLPSAALNLNLSATYQDEMMTGNLDLDASKISWPISMPKNILGPELKLTADFTSSLINETTQYQILLKKLDSGTVALNGTAQYDLAQNIQADFMLKIQELKYLWPQISGTLETHLEIFGPLNDLKAQLKSTSSQVQTGPGPWRDIALNVSAYLKTRAEVQNINSELSLKVADSPGGSINVTAKSNATLNEAGLQSAQIEELQLNGANLNLEGALGADFAFAARPKLVGKIDLHLKSWEQLANLTGGQLSGKALNFNLVLAHNDKEQSIIGSLKAPEINFESTHIKDLSLDFNWADVYELKNITTLLTAKQINFADKTSSGLNFKIESAEAGELNLQAQLATLDGQTQPLKLAGQFWPPKKQLKINKADIIYLGTGLKLNNPVQLDFNEQLKISGLNAALKPSGNLKADLEYQGEKLDLDLSLKNFDLQALNPFITTELPEGQLNLTAQAQAAPGAPLNGQLELTGATKAQGSLPALNIKSKMDASSPRLTTGQTISIKGQTEIALKNASVKPLNVEFALPLLMTAAGLQVKGQLMAALDWQGAISPIWRLAALDGRTLDGTAKAQVKVSGTLENPQVTGNFYLAGANYEDKMSGLSLSDINLESHFNEMSNLKMLLAAKDGRGGNIALEGELTGLKKNQPELKLRGQLDQMSPLHRDDISLMLSGLVNLSGPLNKLEASADIVVERGNIDVSDLLKSTSVPILPISQKRQKVANSSSLLSLALKIKIPRRLFIRGMGLDSEWQGELNVSGAAHEPSLQGVLKPVRGRFDLLSKPFEFNGGEIIFSGDKRIMPILNLELIHHGENIEAIIKAEGPAQKPKLTLSSRPALPQDEILSQVLFGKSASELNRFETLQLANGVRKLATGSGFDLMDDIRKKIGLDVLRFGGQSANGRQTNFSGADNLAGRNFGQGLPTGNSDGEEESSLEAGKYLTDKIYLGVDQGTAASGTGVRVEIELLPNITVKGRSSSNSSQVGIGWKKDY